MNRRASPFGASILIPDSQQESKPPDCPRPCHPEFQSSLPSQCSRTPRPSKMWRGEDRGDQARQLPRCLAPAEMILQPGRECGPALPEVSGDKRRTDHLFNLDDRARSPGELPGDEHDEDDAGASWAFYLDPSRGRFPREPGSLPIAVPRDRPWREVGHNCDKISPAVSRTPSVFNRTWVSIPT
jgi:hypothetical protein